jgi:hypothetical protein
MATMGRYCKAYLLSDLKKYTGWPDTLANLRPPSQDTDEPVAAEPRVLTDEDYFFLQENLLVTDGIFADEHIVFDAVTPEWQRFCSEDLKFEVPPVESFELEEEPVGQAPSD